MKTRCVFSDMHLWGPTPSKDVPLFGPEYVWIGDNHEMKNIPKNTVGKRVIEYQQFLEQCYATGTGVVAGNHERLAGTKFCRNPYWHIEDGVLYFHGDILSYSEKKMRKWREGKMGKSRWRIFGIWLKNIFRNMGGGKSISKKKKMKCIEYMDAFNCHTCVFGHTHPAKLIDDAMMYKGKTYRFINVPRGMTEIQV